VKDGGMGFLEMPVPIYNIPEHHKLKGEDVPLLRLIKHHTMKTYGGNEAVFPYILTLVIDET
jgi:hypothetical protein